jgi:hypothetical protein
MADGERTLTEDETTVLLQLRGILLAEIMLVCGSITSSSRPMQKDSHGDQINIKYLSLGTDNCLAPCFNKTLHAAHKSSLGIVAASRPIDGPEFVAGVIPRIPPSTCSHDSPPPSIENAPRALPAIVTNHPEYRIVYNCYTTPYCSYSRSPRCTSTPLCLESQCF